MKILFVLSGNNDKSSSLVINQAESIISYNDKIKVEYYLVKGKGIKGYLSNVKPLRQRIKEFNPDVIHAHYSFCGFLSFLCFSKKPIVTSLMGSDLHLKMHWRLALFITSAFWDAIIVKSQAMKKKFLLTKSYIIPNGVDFNKYIHIDKDDARKQLGLDLEKQYILFLANPQRPEKNFDLARRACEKISSNQTKLLVVHNIQHEITRLYYYAVDVLILTSFYEGSPNVIKEAMVCNCPVVSTAVGDVKTLFENVEGNFIGKFDSVDFAEKINAALVFAKEKGRTKGRTKISELGIDSATIANKLVHIYAQLANLSMSNFILSPKRVCSKGLWDETIPGIQFDKNGVSNYCRLQEKMMLENPRGIVGEKKWALLINKMKSDSGGGKYNCVIGVSGGVDSSYLLHLAKKEGLKILAVHFDNGFNSEVAVNNIYKITKKLNIDLITYVVNYEEIKDLFVSYMKASLPWIDAPTDLAIKATMYNAAIKNDVKYIIRGNDFRSEGKQPTDWTYSDSRQLRYVHKKFGSKAKLKSYPKQSFFKMIYAGFIKKVKDVRPFYFMEYNKQDAKNLLMNIYDWKDYGGHHHENLFTKFAMAYWLPRKFAIDKRKISLSAQILSKAITRSEGLNQLSTEFDTPQNLAALKNYVLKKLSLTTAEFDVIISASNKDYSNYPSNYALIYKNIKYFKWIIVRLYNFKPMSIDSGEMIK
jgi:N-acetyl sugar amidotransferase